MLDAAYKLPPKALVAQAAGGTWALICLAPFEPGGKIRLTQQRPAEGDKGDAGIQDMLGALFGKNAAHQTDRQVYPIPGAQQLFQTEGAAGPDAGVKVGGADFYSVRAADLIELQQPVQAAVTVPAHLGKDGEVGPAGPPHLADDPPGEPKAVSTLPP